jgi:hypothetical protein
MTDNTYVLYPNDPFVQMEHAISALNVQLASAKRLIHSYQCDIHRLRYSTHPYYDDPDRIAWERRQPSLEGVIACYRQCIDYHWQGVHELRAHIEWLENTQFDGFYDKS